MTASDMYVAQPFQEQPAVMGSSSGCSHLFFTCPSKNVTRCILFDTLFGTNSAPILLIDAEDEGAIVDVNSRATEFYGYSREDFRKLHVWDINTLGRGALSAMREIATWSGGHYPQRFRHRMADGMVRDVQVYAGPIDLVGKSLLLCIIHDVTAVIEVEQFNRLLLESVKLGVCGVDLTGRISFVNPEAVRALGFQHESEVVAADIRRFLCGADGQDAGDHPILQVAVTAQALHDFDCLLYRADGAPFPARVVASPIRVGDRIEGIVISFSDLTRERERDDQMADLINSLPGAVFQAEISAEGRLKATYFSSAANAFLGLADGADLTDATVLAPLLERGQWLGLIRSLRAAARLRQSWEREVPMRGQEAGKWLLCRARPRLKAGGAVLFNGVLLDISDRKYLEIQLKDAALTDSLTGLWNRRRFERELAVADDRFHRSGRPYALIMIDIDHFKQLNDLYGHDVGDETLRRVATTLTQRSQPVGGVARWGGEEFAILLADTDVATAATLAEDIRAAVQHTALPDGGGVTVSIGLGQATVGEKSLDLFRRVDAALYRAKDDGRNRVATA